MAKYASTTAKLSPCFAVRSQGFSGRGNEPGRSVSKPVRQTYAAAQAFEQLVSVVVRVRHGRLHMEDNCETARIVHQVRRLLDSPVSLAASPDGPCDPCPD